MGTLICAICPPPVPAGARRLLLPAEEQFAVTLETPDRYREWIAGRVSMAAALANLSAPRLPMLPLASGAPSMPPGFAGSISHKGPLAVAVANVEVPAVGIDLECVEPKAHVLKVKVLTDIECSRMQLLDDASQALCITAHFAVKEAIFKALGDDEQSIVDFEHIELSAPAAQLVVPRVWTQFAASVMTRDPFPVRAALFWEQGWIIAVASRP